MGKPKAFFNWSTGKDSMLALHRIIVKKELQIEELLTTISTDFGRVSMHGISLTLLARQAECLGISLDTLSLASQISLEDYNQIMEDKMGEFKRRGFTDTGFGDILLEDLKGYREKQLKKVGIRAHFPLWNENTAGLVREFMDLGYKALVVAVNARVLDKSFCGRILDHRFLNDLPAGVDPCGEHGEFHTFVYDGPLFKHPVDFKKGSVFMKEYAEGKEKDEQKTQTWDTRFWFQDLLS